MSGLTLLQGGAEARINKELLEIPAWLTAQEFADLTGVTRTAIVKRVTRNKFKKTKKTKNHRNQTVTKIHFTELPTEILKPILRAQAERDHQKSSLGCDSYDPESAWERYRVIEPVLSGETSTAEAAEGAGVSLRTVQRWVKEWNEAESANRMVGLSQKTRADKGIFRSLEPKVERAAAALWLRKEKFSIRHTHRLLTMMEENGDLPEGSVPSYKTIERYLQNTIPKQIEVLGREGDKAYKDKFDKFIFRDWDSYEPRDVYFGDHHQFDLFVNHRGKLIRPWLTAWFDGRTRACTGWVIVEKPDSESIQYSLRDAIMEKKGSPFWGKPVTVYIDNGKDYRSKWVNGKPHHPGQIDFSIAAKTLITGLNINVTFAQPYNARAKIIEPWFKTVEEQFVKACPGYCGNRPANRPDDLQRKMTGFKKGKYLDYFMTMDEFTESFKNWLYIYHTQPHSGLNGKSPKEVWEANAPLPEDATDQTVEFLLYRSTTRVVTGNGVRIHGVGTKVAYYDHPALRAIEGERVEVRTDPKDLSSVYVFCDDQFVCVAKNAERMRSDATLEDLSNALREQKAQAKRDRETLKFYKSEEIHPDAVIREAAKRAAKEISEVPQQKAAVVHAIPQFEGNHEQRSLENINNGDLTRNKVANFLANERAGFTPDAQETLAEKYLSLRKQTKEDGKNGQTYKTIPSPGEDG